MKTLSMESTARALVAPGKGILAADESSPTIAKRFKDIKLASTEENRRAYRDLLFTTPGLSQFISGVILFDETMRQNLAGGTSMPAALNRDGIIPGIKVDLGAVDMAGFPGEKMTQGLDGLGERLAEYVKMGARFTKWRAVITVGPGIPSATCIDTNARSLALFAALSQAAGLVPIVEPEVLMDGDHTLARCEEVTHFCLQRVFAALSEHRVKLEGMLLKTGMVVPGDDCPDQASVGQIAAATVRCLRRVVPPAVPGVVFLSGGQSDEDATERLNAICAEQDEPWKLSFSFGRALQAPSLKVWKGLPANVRAAQKALHHRARCNGAAVQGKYTAQMEKSGK